MSSRRKPESLVAKAMPEYDSAWFLFIVFASAHTGDDTSIDWRVKLHLPCPERLTGFAEAPSAFFGHTPQPGLVILPAIENPHDDH
jgi:hypothetical protein